MFSSQGHSNEYTQYTILNIKKKIALNYLKSAAMRLFLGTQERIRKSHGKGVIKSVFEPLKFYCTVKILNIGTCMSEQTI